VAFLIVNVFLSAAKIVEAVGSGTGLSYDRLIEQLWPAALRRWALYEKSCVTYILLLGDERSPLCQTMLSLLELESFPLRFLSLQAADADSLSACFAGDDISLVLDLSAFAVELPAELPDNAEFLAKTCAANEAALIYLSSHEVFGGENKTSYDEKDQPAPIRRAGQLLWDAERAVQLNNDRYIILRLSWLMADDADNVYTRLLSLLGGQSRVRVSSALRGAPTFIEDAARVMAALIKQVLSQSDNWGVYHYASSDACSEWEFADHLRQVLLGQNRAVAELEDTGADELESSAVLSCRRGRDDFGIQQRSWRQGVEARVRDWVQLQQT